MKNNPLKQRGCYRPDNVKKPEQISRYPWVFDQSDQIWVNNNIDQCRALFKEYGMRSVLCIRSGILKFLNDDFISPKRIDYLNFSDLFLYHPKMVVQYNPKYKIIKPYTMVVKNFNSEDPLLLIQENDILDLGFSSEILLSNQELAHPLKMGRYPVKKAIYKAGNKDIEYLGTANIEKFFMRPIFVMYWKEKPSPRNKTDKMEFFHLSDLLNNKKKSTITDLILKNIFKKE